MFKYLNIFDISSNEEFIIDRDKIIYIKKEHEFGIGSTTAKDRFYILLFDNNMIEIDEKTFNDLKGAFLNENRRI